MWASCTQKDKQETLDGAQLTATYCGGCHQVPDPAMLDQKTWERYVLPRMGYMLGIYPNDSVRNSLFEAGEGGERVRVAGLFPKKAVISEKEWKAIQEYILRLAPEQLALPAFPMIEDTTRLFEIKVPRMQLSPPSATLVQFSPFGGFYIGDANTQALYHFDKSSTLLATARVKEGAVSMAETEEVLILTVMGSFSPTDAALGFVMGLEKRGGKANIMIDSLQRPVHSTYADFDLDGRTDALIAEFGKWTGSLSWWKDMGGGRFERNVLRNQPGALRTAITDLNGDGAPDILALFGQGDEGLFAYYNNGTGRFTEERLLTFGSSWGSVTFEFTDFNGDGHKDVLYVCGDNADYPPILKPYHGIRVFLNDGKNHFAESLHLPLYGAYGAKAADFDQDGDLDILAISFFSDYTKDTHAGLVFFEQTTPGNFKRNTIKGADVGRWIVMDAADYDEDGDFDVLLGSLAFEIVPPHPLLQTWVDKGIAFVLLENQIK